MSFRVGDKVEWKSPLPSVVQTNDAGIVVSIAHPVLTRRGVNKAILVYEFIGSDREIFSVWSRCCPIGLLSESWGEREIPGAIRFKTVRLRFDKLFACLNLRYRPLRFINFA